VTGGGASGTGAVGACLGGTAQPASSNSNGHGNLRIGVFSKT
jgi:hypothetical protein